MNFRAILHWVLIIIAALFLLWLVTGCEGLAEKEMAARRVHIDADCEANTIDVRLNIDESTDSKELEVTRP